MDKKTPSQAEMKMQAKMQAAQMEQMRAQILEQELSARSWKAYYEKMYYSIESEKLEPEYAEVLKRREAKLAEERKRFEDFMQTMKDSEANLNGSNPLGALTVGEEAKVIPMDAKAE